MIHLSRLILNPRNRRVQRELARSYEMHRSIMHAFRDGLKEGDDRVLWRVDEHPQLGLILLVQSWDAPDWSWLTEDSARGYLLPLAESNPSVKPVELHLTIGQVLRFRLRANPTVKKDRPGKNQGRRVGIYDEESQMAWLERKGELHGFRVLQVQIRQDGKVTNERAIHRDHAIHKLELLSVQFDGLLQITDPAKAIRAIEAGIGSAKGFGFGLLSLAPAIS